MSKLLDWFSPWWAKLIAIGAIVAGLLWAWHAFTSHISAAAVADNNLLWVGKFNQQKTELNTLGQQFIDLKDKVTRDRKQAAADAEGKINQEKNRAEKATRDYQRELQAKKQIATERDRLVAVLDEQRTKRMPELTRPIAAGDNDSAETRRLREFADGLGRILAQCQQTAADLRRAAATAIDRVGAAEAAARALKVEP
jgi:hypothetical protein